MKRIIEFLNYEFKFSDDIIVSVKSILIFIIILIILALFLKMVRRLATKKLPEDAKQKFNSAFSFVKYFLYLVVLLFAFDNMGINVTAIFAASTALLVGVGLALQTFFQDIISGVFILIDQSVHVDDIIEIEGKVGRIIEIRLRTTRAVTIDNKVLIIPNHKYLTSSVYNWTENGVQTRESVTVGVAYGTDLDLVKKVLLQVASENVSVLQYPEPSVQFIDFGDSSLVFKLIFTVSNSFEAATPKSDIRFAIDKLFKENNISIPFPQREVRMINK